RRRSRGTRPPSPRRRAGGGGGRRRRTPKRSPPSARGGLRGSRSGGRCSCPLEVVAGGVEERLDAAAVDAEVPPPQPARGAPDVRHAPQLVTLDDEPEVVLERADGVDGVEREAVLAEGDEAAGEAAGVAAGGPLGGGEHVVGWEAERARGAVAVEGAVGAGGEGVRSRRALLVRGDPAADEAAGGGEPREGAEAEEGLSQDGHGGEAGEMGRGAFA